MFQYSVVLAEIYTATLSQTREIVFHNNFFCHEQIRSSRTPHSK